MFPEVIIVLRQIEYHFVYLSTVQRVLYILSVYFTLFLKLFHFCVSVSDC